MRRSPKNSAHDELAALPILRGSTRQELARVSELADHVTYDHGDIVVRQGEISREFYVLLTGAAEVVHDDTVIATLGPGDIAGEMAALEPAPRSATVLMTTDGSWLVFGPREFGAALEDVPVLSKQVMVVLARRLRGQ